MKASNIAVAIASSLAASACSGVLGIETDSTLVACNDKTTCPTGLTCASNQCVPDPDGEQAGGVGSTGTTVAQTRTSLSSAPSGGTTSAVTASSGGVTTAATSAEQAGGAVGFGTSTSAVETSSTASVGGSHYGGTSAVRSNSSNIARSAGATNSTVMSSSLGGNIGSGGASSSTGAETTVTLGGTQSGGTAADSGVTAVEQGGRTAGGGGSASGSPSSGGMETGRTSSAATGGVASGGAGTGGTSTCTGTSVGGGIVQCVPGAHRCHVPENTAGNPVYWQTCGTDCSWNSGTYCSQYCTIADGCETAPSCNVHYPSLQNLSYCASTPLEGATFNRSKVRDAYGYEHCTSSSPCPATVGPFSLDVYEVTVNRFRQFVAAYSQSMIAPGSGTNAKIPTDTGWNAAWNTMLPIDRAALTQQLQDCSGSTYTETATTQDSSPMNCVGWYLALAFCIWDGGRLPTEVEWYYVASAAENRYFPWSSPPENPLITPQHAVYTQQRDGTEPVAPASVGSTPLGIARWGQYDIAGNVEEWLYDSHSDLYVDLYTGTSPCVDCANVDPTSRAHVVRGGAFPFDENQLTNSTRLGVTDGTPRAWFGFRCARDL